ncbi:MAG: helix-turn-helix transcriptional regulator [Oscillibacter sp.]|jgi:transcriptional regulator with XRE-family HTH domain|nr:helix-turn-helix transcriptional regulator [Oscillibacter sp.]QUO34771.1 helix-turn-helix transcriptional regulator [Clostridiaceae bacterium Marseille-Q4149]
MEKEEFARRMSQLRQAKGVSARDMSLSLGQSAGYINNIENGVNLPSMAMFFYICDYLEVTPEEFFSVELADPMRLKRLNQSLRRLTGHQLELLELLVQEMK